MNVVLFRHSGRNHLLMFRAEFPEIGIAGVLCTPGVRYIEHIPEPGSIPGVVNESDPLCTPPNVPPHTLIPQVVFGAGSSIWPLGIDHELLMVGVLV